MYSFGPANSATHCSGIIPVNEVAFVWGIEPIFKKHTICTSATDLHSFISNLMVLHFSSQLKNASRDDFMGCFNLLSY